MRYLLLIFSFLFIVGAINAATLQSYPENLTLAAGDFFIHDDVSDLTADATGTTKKIKGSTIKTFVQTTIPGGNITADTVFIASMANGDWGFFTIAANVATVDANAWTSANIASYLSDETGTGLTVFNISPTLTTPIIVTGGSITDAGGDEYIEFIESAAPVNHLTISSGNTTIGPVISSEGEANVDLILDAKGTGNVVINSGPDLDLDGNNIITVGDFSMTGVFDAGGATSTEFVNSPAPTTNATGEIALDTTIVDHHPLFQYFDGGENMTIIAVDTAELPATDNQVVSYDAATDKWIIEAQLAGGTGAFDDTGDPVVLNTTTKDVHIGNGIAALVGKLEIGGDADQPILILEGHSTQTDDIFIIRDDGGSEVFAVDESGTLVASGTITATAAAVNTIDAITEIAGGIRSGVDGLIITGLPGAMNVLGMWNTDGDMVNSGILSATVPTTIGTIDQFSAITSAALAGEITDETGTGLAVFGTAPTFTTSITSTLVLTDLIDGVGAVDLDIGSADITDVTILTDGGTIVLDGNITQDAGTTLFMGGLLDATGAVDMDYGSADITDHTFISDGGTIIIDGTTITSSSGFILAGGAFTHNYGNGAATSVEIDTDGTGSGEFIVPNDSIGFDEIDSTTGAYDFGGVTSFELVNSAAPTTDATGEIALDTTITDHQPLFQYFDGAENMSIIAIDTAQLPALDNEIIVYDAATDKWLLESPAAGGAFDDTGDPIVQNTITKDVHIGDDAGTLVGKLEIGGDADQPQFIVEGFSTQTDSIFIVQNDADTQLVNIDNSGLILGLVGFDGIGAIDLDYGSADITDHTFIADGTTDADFVVPLTSISGAEMVSNTVTATQLDETDAYTWTGLHDFTGGTARLPLSATPTMAVDGDWAVDITVTDFSHGIMKYFDGEELGVVSMPIAEFGTPADGTLVSYNATNDEFELVAAGAADNLGNHTATQDLAMATFNIDDGGVIFLNEQAEADANVAGDGQIWVNTATPNELFFTDDADTDFQLGLAKTGVFRIIYIDAGAMVPRVTAGATADTEEHVTNDINVDQYLFDGASTEGVQFKMMMPDEWDLGTVKMKLYWDAATSASAADLVSFNINAGALSNDDAIDAALGTVVEVDDVVIAVGDMHVTAASASITVGGTPALEDMIIWQIERDHDDAADDMTEDLKLLGVSIQYQESTTEPVEW